MSFAERIIKENNLTEMGMTQLIKISCGVIEDVIN